MQVALASVEDARAVIDAAAAAFPAWRDTSLAKRSAILFKFRELLNARKGELAEIITSEHGKVVSDALGEVSRGQEVVEFACGIPHSAQGRVHRERLDQGRRLLDPPAAGPGRDHQPVQLPGHGADVVLPHRHRRRQHRRAQAVARRTRRRRCGWPSCGPRPGCRRGVQRAAGRQDRRRRAADQPGDQVGVSFVGSTPIARYVYETGTAHGKRVQALGGAKNHAVILPDADLDLAADAMVNAGFGSAGRALHGDLARAWRSARSPTTWSPRSPNAPPPSRPATAPVTPTWARW